MDEHDLKSMVIWLFIALVCVVGLFYLGASIGYRDGYRNGQIDHANGRALYASVETDAGTRWYRKDNADPGKLFERETPE